MPMLSTPTKNGPERPFATNPSAERPVLRVETEGVHFTNRRGGSQTFTFHKAIKWDAKLRFAVCGLSGSGKTYTLLQIATELGGPVALVDTERGSASKYADIFEFDVLELASYDPTRLIEIIDEVAKKGYRALCIDSLSHFWMG